MGILSEQLRVIEALNPIYNALTSVFDVHDEPTGPLAGITFSVKDNIDVAGAATTHGLKSLAGNVKSADAPIVARLRAAGATPIAHANMPTWNARGMHTYSELAGHTINPWDSTLSPGGSSGGDAVAVATGMVHIGIGQRQRRLAASAGVLERRLRPETEPRSLPAGQRARPARSVVLDSGDASRMPFVPARRLSRPAC